MSSSESAWSAGAKFAPAWWVPGSHGQTVWGSLTRSRRLAAFHREVLETPDGDELVLDHVDGPAGSPRVILLHGLEGSSFSVYIQGLSREIARRNWRATVLNFRSCARDPEHLARMLPNRRPRLYHSGETSDLDFLVRTLSAREPHGVLLAIGSSLGGNVLLKWLGEHPGQRDVAAAVALSTPYDLGASGRYMESAGGRVYVRNFLRTLRAKALEAARRFPEAAAKIDIPRTLTARTFWEFDDAANAPLHDFAGADDYYRRASSIGFLPRVATPTLCMSSQDDPFLPREALERARSCAGKAVEFLITARGGHIGWVTGRWPGRPRYFAEQVAVDWLAGR
ncbi:MAG: alpha/beta fold hydrolase [Acidobacteriota bacterium]